MIRFEDIYETVRRHHPEAQNLDVLRKAYVFSAVEHKGQTRASGEPYLVHPLEVAAILADMRMDPACVAVGSIAATCKAPRTGQEVKECGILHSTSKAIRLGRTVQTARRAHRDPIEALVEAEGGRLLFTGKIADVARRATEGFLRGTARLDGLGDDRGRRFELAFQNEFAVGWLDGVPRVMTPDLICVMDTVSGEAIGTETLRYGQRVSVVALSAPPILLTPKGLEHVGPRAFGYDLDFVSVFA